ncbi:MAG: TonB-dependent copper receptor [Rhodocyclaceae bacterium]|nr:TonB-dependent copper receptor [Rhodocyclaceae bacterium]
MIDQRLLAGALALALGPHALAQHELTLSPVVVTGSPMAEALVVTTDPKAPRQPVPAHDGADMLKSIPGFSVVRKGGTDGDPVLRGMAASRLGVLLDGETILGGCGMRMDPPTAYVFPEAYDLVTVLKGPQSVKHGPGNSAGLVLFERRKPVFDAPGARGDLSLLLGSAGRNDQVLTAQAGTPGFYADASATRSDANDYQDGDGEAVHSAFTRWSTNLALGWTPDRNTRLELTLAASDGEARYADRTMDGVKFERSNVGVSFRKADLAPWLRALEAQVYRNYVDHVMDNYSLRESAMAYAVSNPDRLTRGGKLMATLAVGEATDLDVGSDLQTNEHALRSARGTTGEPDYEALARADDMRFRNLGLFAEMKHVTSAGHVLASGLRLDRSRAEDLRSGKTSSGSEVSDTLHSGFVRWEHALASGDTAYLGLGHSERSADYWERTRSPAATSMMMTGMASTFELDPERTTQLDVGLLHRAGAVTASLSAFAARHRDYILVELLPEVSSYAVNARNINARSWGMEADAAWRFAPSWTGTGTLAWVHGENDSDDRPLGQMPPLEARFGLEYERGPWSLGGLLRLVASQGRSAPGSGTIVGQDIGDTAGFGVVSLNAGYRPHKGVTLTGGVDNLLDKTYAEHISRSSAAIPGYEQSVRVNEPGRTLWVKLQLALD